VSFDSFPSRLDPSRRSPAQLIESRRRVLLLGAGALLVALLGASVANAQRAILLCVDGRLVAYQGRFMPLGSEEIDDERLPPLRVASSACEDETFDDRAALEARYMEIAMGRADDAIHNEDRDALETSLDALEGLPADADETLTRRYRQLVEALLRVDVQSARQSHQQALQRIEQARQAGVDERALRSAEKALGLLSSSATPSAPVMPKPGPEQPPSSIVEGEPTLSPASPRSL